MKDFNIIKMRREDKKIVNENFKNIKIFELEKNYGHYGICRNFLILVEEKNKTYLFTMTEDIYSYDLIRNSLIYKINGMINNKRKDIIKKLFYTCIRKCENIDNDFLDKYNQEISNKIQLNISFGRKTTFEDIITTII